MAQKKLTTLEYALLGLIGTFPATGYDIHKVFSTTPFAHFSSSPGAIYPALRRLANIGLLEARLDAARETRPRRVYSLTRVGRKALDAWLHQPVTRDELIRGAGAPILRFALAGGRLTGDEILSYLEIYRKAVAAYVEELYGYAGQTAGSENLYGRLALHHGIRSFESELEWTKWAATEIRRAGRRSAKQRSSR
jgi:DNA-binding PadR family transcriptional regulator